MSSRQAGARVPGGQPDLANATLGPGSCFEATGFNTLPVSRGELCKYLLLSTLCPSDVGVDGEESRKSLEEERETSRRWR